MKVGPLWLGCPGGSADPDRGAHAAGRDHSVEHLEYAPAVGGRNGRRASVGNGIGKLVKFRHEHHRYVVAVDVGADDCWVHIGGLRRAAYLDLVLEEVPPAQSHPPGAPMDVNSVEKR